jgi:RNase P/RNase MRP subunit POP5
VDELTASLLRRAISDFNEWLVSAVPESGVLCCQHAAKSLACMALCVWTEHQHGDEDA